MIGIRETRLIALLAAVQPAITTAPKLFVAAWTHTFPTDTTDCCRAAGRAIFIIFQNSARSNRRSACAISTFRILHSRTIQDRTVQTAWDRVDARAPPRTPMEQFTIKKRSPATLRKNARIRKYSGVLESPTAIYTAFSAL